MNKQLINAIKWIEALLSGKYKQDKGKLGDEKNGFCCWGLGCFITGHEYEPKEEWKDSFAKIVGFLNYQGGITPSIIKGSNKTGYEYLSEINDEGIGTFKEIGEYLIKHAATNFEKEVAKDIKQHFNEKNKK